MSKCRFMEGKTCFSYIMSVFEFVAKNGRKGWESKTSNMVISFVYSHISSFMYPSRRQIILARVWRLHFVLGLHAIFNHPELYPSRKSRGKIFMCTSHKKNSRFLQQGRSR
jgi:hypothetical protein